MRRYADLFHRIYHGNQILRISRKALIKKEIVRYKRQPTDNIYVPYFIHTMITTQKRLFRSNDEIDPPLRDTIYWALRVSDFIRRRSASLIARRFIEWFYKPNGLFVQKSARKWNDHAKYLSSCP